MKVKIKMRHRSNRYDINRPRSRHRLKYSRYIKTVSLWRWLYVLSNNYRTFEAQFIKT